MITHDRDLKLGGIARMKDRKNVDERGRAPAWARASVCTHVSGPPPLTVFLTFISRKYNSHSYTHLILALGIVREPTVWGFITSKYIFDEK